MESLIGLGFFLIIFLFSGALLGISAYFKNKKLEKDILQIKQKLRQIQTMAAYKEKSVEKEIDITTTAANVESAPVMQVRINEEEPIEKKGPTQIKDEMVPAVTITSRSKKQNEDEKTESKGQEIETEKKTNKLIKTLEKHFLENWTGIIGALITVVGIGFLGVFTALKLSEMYRFFMIVLISLINLVLYFILRFQKKWLKLGLWLRSMAAALFLLACAGAGGIEGLRWIKNPIIGLVVLCMGIGANILLAILGKKEVIASIHLLLSLAALVIAPQNQVIFIIATIVAIAGIIMTFREKWKYHLLLSVTLYFTYILFYYFLSNPLSMSMKITGIAGISGLSILSLFVHYRKIYTHPAFDMKPFLTHLLTWLYFGAGVYIYSPRVSWISLPLGAGAILCFLLAHRARVLKIRWLFTMDILMSQVIAVIAVFTLLELDIPYSPIACILVMESIAFSTIVLIEGEDLLYHSGQWFFYFFSLLLIILSFINMPGQEIPVLFRNSLILLICITSIILYHIFINRYLEQRITSDTLTDSRKQLFKAHKILCGVIIGILFIPLYISLRHTLTWITYMDVEYLFLIPIGALIGIRKKIRSDGLGVSILFLLIIMHIYVWQDPVLTSNVSWQEQLVYCLPLFILDCTCIIFALVTPLNRHVRWPGIYLFFSHLFIVTYFIFNPISPLIPGVVWLILSVVMLEISRLLRRLLGDTSFEKGSPDIHFLHTGYMFLGVFAIRHILVHLQSGQYVWFVKARLLIAVFTLFIFVYWAFSKKPEGKKVSKSYDVLHPLFPEYITIFTILTLAVELNKTYHPVTWIFLSICTLFLGMTFKQKLSRFRFYSLFLYWISVIHVIFLTSPLSTPSLHFFDQTWCFSLITTLLQFGFILFFYKKGDLQTIDLPPPLKWVQYFTNLIEKRKNLWMYYPLFISIALFLIWSFDTSILTLLLSAECFLIFVISIILRENHFRYVSLAGLGGCVIRLAFYDLAASNILTKAIVCIGVGLLLIGMNSLYNKFSGRYNK